MKIQRGLLMVLCSAVALCGCSHLPDNKDVLFQTSTISALLEGAYDGEVTCKELKKHGDFGIGTFDALDGEMLALEGKVYQIRADGKAYCAEDSLSTPFAAVKFFEADKTIVPDTSLNFKELEECLDRLLPTKNILYALKVEGVFKYIKTRSVPKQRKPYPRLVEVVKNQPTFEFHNIRGTIVGFRLPAYVDGINVPGYHLHFITEDRSAGGHLLECSTSNVTIEVDYTRAFFVVLPEHGDFYQVDMTEKKEGELERVEK